MPDLKNLVSTDYQLLFKALPGFMLAFSPEMRLLAATDSFLSVLNIPPEALMGRKITEILLDYLPRPALVNWEKILLKAYREQSPQTLILPVLPEALPINRPNENQPQQWHINIKPVFNHARELCYLLQEINFAASGPETGPPARINGTLTDQKNSERQLKDNVEQFRFLAELLPQLTWTSNAHGEVDYFNQRWLEYTGLSLQECLENKWIQAIHPDDRATAKKRWLTCLITGENPEIEFRIRRHDGIFHWFLLWAAPLRNEYHAIQKWFGICTNIHDRKQNQELLEASNAHFRYLAESLPQLVWTADINGRPDYFNDRWRQLAGLEGPIPPNWNWSEFIHPEDKDRVINLGLQLVSEGKVCEMEYRLRNQHGYYRWFLARAIPLRNDSGTIIKWIGTATDIQELITVREQIQQNAFQLHTVLDTLPQMTWTARPDGAINYYNERWSDYLGTSVDELLKWGWAKFIYPDDLEASSQAWLTSLATGQPFSYENRWRNRNGQYRWFLVRGLPVRDSSGLIIMWVGSHTDIEEQKQTEQLLLSKNEELKKINEDLDRFVYTASHDLKLPIINMASIFDELKTSVIYQDPDADKLILMFQKALQQIYGTISDLSEIGKFQKNIYDTVEQVNLATLTEEVKESIQDLITASSARITTNFEEIPFLHFSRVNLKSIIYNLLSNAIKYQVPGRKPDISLRTYAHDAKYTVLSVTDNGLGIDLSKHQNKLFQMYKRFHNHVPGSGLGLYIVQRIMQNNHGYIQAESIVNEGTTFRVYFFNKTDNPT